MSLKLMPVIDSGAIETCNTGLISTIKVTQTLKATNKGVTEVITRTSGIFQGFEIRWRSQQEVSDRINTSLLKSGNNGVICSST